MAQLKLNSWFLLFTFLLLFSSIQAIDIKYCDKKENYDVKVEEIKIFPNPVMTSKPATFNILAVTVQAISGGKVVIDVYYFGVHVHQETSDLCEEISCPVAAGNFVLSHTQTLPGFTPPDKNNRKLSCFNFNFKIGFGSLVSES